MRIISWFSCGATSAIATKIALDDFPDAIIAYCNTNSEHEDNKRFILDCENWYGKKIEILQSEKYHDIWDVFDKTRYLAGINGARCTTELKKKVRRNFEMVDDVQIFGFDYDEIKRADRFRENNPEVNVRFPLIDQKLTKKDCLQILSTNKIDLPYMYVLGYRNNNCIGCVKGQAGYWNKIRKDFPDVFNKMSTIERQLNVALCKSYAGDGLRKRVFLDELLWKQADMKI